MALSVGVFQRPVEYRVNCLEFTYPFSGLNLSYTWLALSVNGEPLKTGFDQILNFTYSMSYSGFVRLTACGIGVDETGKSLIKIKPKYFVNTIHTINEFNNKNDYATSIQLLEQAHQTAISSFNARIKFYEGLKSFIKSKAVENGLDQSKINDYNIIFDFSDKYETGEFYLSNGSSYYYDGENQNLFLPVGIDEYGVTLWDFYNAGLFNTRLTPDGVYLSGATPVYFDPLIYEGDGNILNPIQANSIIRSEESINNYFNYYKSFT